MSNTDQHRARPAVSLEAARIARRYYLDGLQKSEIADEFGISRFKVARLLDEAKASGIVRIYVDMPSEIDLPLGEELSARYGIRRVVVVRSADDEPDVIATAIGAAAAAHLADTISADDTVGISWGTSLTRTVDALSEVAAADVVQLVGGVRGGELNISGGELVRRLSEKTGGRAFPLHAPLLVGSPEMARQLMHDASLADATERFGSLTRAVVGIGSWSPPRSSLYTEFSAEERAELTAQGAVADICAIVLDAAGTPLHTPALDRSIGISVEQLRRVPDVIAIAGGAEKSTAIAAALRSGLVNTLITDAHTTAALL